MIKNEGVWVNLHSLGQSEAHYNGKFLLKPWLTHGEKADGQRLAERYNMGIETPAERYFYTMLAYTKFHVLEAQEADWWDIDNLLEGIDQEPIYELWNLLGGARNAAKGKKDAELESISIQEQIKIREEAEKLRAEELKKSVF
jgi:hypothetical protein